MILLFLFAQCKEDDNGGPIPASKGCVCPSAEIYIEQRINNTNFIGTPNNDDLFVQRVLQFRSPYRETGLYKHTWYIGLDTVSEAQLIRDFSKQSAPKTYVISHVVKWKPDPCCSGVSNMIGYDSSSKTFTITSRYYDLAVLGKFRIVFDTATFDSIDIEFYFSRFNTPDSFVVNPLAGEFGDYDGDIGPSEQIDFRVRGMKLFNKNIGQLLDIKNEAIDKRTSIVSNTYIKFGNSESSLSMGKGFFSIDLNRSTCKGAFFNGNNYYRICGRKIN